MQIRHTSTTTNIKKTFIQLLNTKGFDNLTVSDIARGAGINRGTFYLHYVDKYDLMEKLEMEIVYDLKQIMLLDAVPEPDTSVNPANLISYRRIVKALYYLKEDFDLISALSGKGGDANFPTLIKEVMEETLRAKISTMDHLNFSKKGIPEEYAIEILLSGIIGIVMVWIKNGSQESPEEIAQMIELAKQISPYELLL